MLLQRFLKLDGEIPQFHSSFVLRGTGDFLRSPGSKLAGGVPDRIHKKLSDRPRLGYVDLLKFAAIIQLQVWAAGEQDSLPHPESARFAPLSSDSTHQHGAGQVVLRHVPYSVPRNGLDAHCRGFSVLAGSVTIAWPVNRRDLVVPQINQKDLPCPRAERWFAVPALDQLAHPGSPSLQRLRRAQEKQHVDSRDVWRSGRSDERPRTFHENMHGRIRFSDIAGDADFPSALCRHSKPLSALQSQWAEIDQHRTLTTPKHLMAQHSPFADRNARLDTGPKGEDLTTGQRSRAHHSTSAGREGKATEEDVTVKTT